MSIMHFQHRYRSLFIIITALILIPIFISSQDRFTVDDAPGELSQAHHDSPGLKNCLACHTEELEVPVEQCLSCHVEIAQRISLGHGYHKDKDEDCALCHIEHQGKKGELVDFNISDFKHEETGYSLQGIHKRIKDCRICHQQKRSHSRKKTQSYLLKDNHCRSCHQSPHPGNQDICQSCHGQESWRVEIWQP